MNVSLGKNILNDLDLDLDSSSSSTFTPDNTDTIDNTKHGNNERLGNLYDFSKSCNKPIDVNDPDVPPFKNFRITYANGGDDTPQVIRVHKTMTLNFLQRVVKIFGDYHLDMKKIEVTYPVRRSGDSVDEFKVKFVADEEVLKESLDTMFSYAEPDAHLIVRDISKRASKARTKKPSEKLFKIFRDLKTVNKKAYEVLMEDEDTIDSYLSKVRTINIMLGSSEAINMLSPAYFLCPFPTCKGNKPLLLRSFNNLSSVEDHLLKHDISDTHRAPATTLLKRYQCLQKTDFLRDNYDLSIAEASAKLDVLGYQGSDTHSKNLGSLFMPAANMEFRGKHLHTKREVLLKIINHEEEPLQGIPDLPSNPFAASKRKSSDTDFVVHKSPSRAASATKVSKTVSRGIIFDDSGDEI